MSLERLCELYPLAPQWKISTIVEETTSVGGVQIYIAGLRADDVTGQMATGSAGDLRSSPLTRAYFELLERTSIFAACEGGEQQLVAKAMDGTELEKLDKDSVLPRSEDPSRWRYARSNGVAAGRSWEEACSRAELELWERDRILRSWYGETRPVRIEPPLDLPAELDALYTFESYLFTDRQLPFPCVVGVFGFPKVAHSPFLCGFGARRTQDAALAAAASECLQRLGFLWGEDIPSVEPEFSPTPDFHQEFFLCPLTHGRLRHWLDGGNVGLRCSGEPASDQIRPFVDLTPRDLASKVFVAKAMPLDELPLVFGECHPKLGQVPDHLRIHPIS
jgi:hypothetical protein